MEDSVEYWINDFQKHVIKHFGFLTHRGFHRDTLKRKQFEYPQDKEVEISYLSNRICISISWFLIYQDVGVSIKELENGKLNTDYSVYGYPQYGNAISLFELAEYKSKSNISRPLPEALLGDRTIMKKWKERANLINDNFEKVIADFAELLRNYAEEILNGDLTIFPEVQEYSRTKMEGL